MMWWRLLACTIARMEESSFRKRLTDRATSPFSPLPSDPVNKRYYPSLWIGSGVDPGRRANLLDLASASLFEYRRLSPSLRRPAHPQARLPSPYGQMPAPSAGGAHHARSLFQQLLEPAAPALGSSHADGQGRLALPWPGACATAPPRRGWVCPASATSPHYYPPGLPRLCARASAPPP
ncbi:uncharacterized protein [Miscanthus floridulus]|uniref:uncharacterized protein n=1 Tax=Miscanthus floridulus TaxID=154761 RepID=UPI003459027F